LAIGGLALGTGYFWALLRREHRPVSQALIDFHRRDQMQRLKKFLMGNRVSSGAALQPSPDVRPHSSE
jgi:hypothetical protein